MSFTHAGVRGLTETEVRAHMMKVLIGIDPHKASVALAVVDEAVGELLECASFPQNRVGLRALERWAKRFPESVVGPSRTLAASVDTWPRGWQQPASRWWMCRPSFQHECGCSRAAMLAKTMSWTLSPPRWPLGVTNGWQRSIPKPARK